MIELFDNYKYLKQKYKNSRSIIFKKMYAQKIENLAKVITDRLGIKDVESLINADKFHQYE